MLESRDKRLAITDMRPRVTPAEWRARVDLAACYRLLALYEMSDMGANHISLRVPGEPGSFLINPYGMLYEEITASSLFKIDHDGGILDKPEYGDFDFGINRAGFVIHGAIHRASPKTDCVIHTHTWAGMAVSALACGLLPITQTSMRFARIAYHEYQGVALDVAEQASLVADLGACNAMILRNHGLLTVGDTIGEAFNAMHRLELSCKTQLAAMACNTHLNAVPEPIVAATWNQYQPNTRRPYGVMEWPALLRRLDKLDPSYAT